ncbi:hypothetical protein [Methylococcus sp. EFPC2]|uniref:hypothetical protein n=1 Tax=Methylococcus sp. EFPC2 TaxID=2812648 RepID=UPI0019689BAF|nr:hypothetical protein [Methylococcus sp. EFPC2]QSA96095.1 hypothetical protein JWZ97_12720 [Methylococcus sp. EFPC2]
MSKIAKKLIGVVLAGFIGLAGSAFAAENAAGVVEHTDLTVKSIKAALEAAKAGNAAESLANIKQGRQHYKEITGDAAGKPLQDAIKVLREGQVALEAGDTKKGAEILTGVVSSLEKIQSGIKK